MWAISSDINSPALVHSMKTLAAPYGISMKIELKKMIKTDNMHYIDGMLLISV